MRRAALGLALALGCVALAVLGHLALIEIGREVVTLRTQGPDGRWQETRLWIVDDQGSAWLHSAGSEWRERFEASPIVELERGGATGRYRARPLPGPHPRIDARLREKYGIADRWVRFVSPDGPDVLVVRLDPLEGG